MKPGWNKHWPAEATPFPLSTAHALIQSTSQNFFKYYRTSCDNVNANSHIQRICHITVPGGE